MKFSRRRTSLSIQCIVHKSEAEIIQDTREVFAGTNFVEKISIEKCENISGRFIREFNFTNVRELKLKGQTSGSNSGLEILSSLPELTKLDITASSFRLTHQLIATNRKLSKIDVSDNQKVSIANNSFSRLERLQHLTIQDNNLQSLDFLRETQNLETLNLQGNKIQVLEADLFVNMKKLRTLHMGGNRFSRLPPGLLDHMPHLETFIINCNHFETFPSGLLRHNKNLTQFELDNQSSRCRKGKKTRLPRDMFLSAELRTITFRNVFIARLPRGWLTNCSGNTLSQI